MSKINWTPSPNHPVLDWGGIYKHATFWARYKGTLIYKEEGIDEDGKFTIYYQDKSDETFTSLTKFLKTVK